MTRTPLYIVIHIPKTAGQTVQANFGLNFSPQHSIWLYARHIGFGLRSPRLPEFLFEKLTAQTRCVFGHIVHPGVAQWLQTRPTPIPFEPRLITFLREPAQRCISLYFYYRDHFSGPAHDEIVENNWTLEQWIEQSQYVALCNDQVRRLTFDALPGTLAQRELEPHHLELAKERLREFWFVGTLDNFEEDALFLYGALGFRRFHPARVVNASVNRQEPAPATLQQLHEMNALDQELWEFAKELGQQRRQTPDFARSVAKARSWRKFSRLWSFRAKPRAT